MKTSKSVEPLQDESGMNKLPETRNMSENEMKSIENIPIRSALSVELSVTLDEANSESRSLLDDSILCMHGLLKSVAENVRAHAKGKDGEAGFMSYQGANSAANLAKQVGGLMKLKLEIHRQMNKER